MKSLETTDFLQYKFLSQLQLSPDEKYLAFVVAQCDEVHNGYRCVLYLLDPDTKSLRQLTQGGSERSFCFLDEDTILYAAKPDEETAHRIASGEAWTCYHTVRLSTGDDQVYMRLPKRVSKIMPMGADRFLVVADHQLYAPDPHDYQDAEREAVLRQLKERSESYIVAHEMPFKWDGIGITDGLRNRLYLYNRIDETFTPISQAVQNVEYVDFCGNKVLYTARAFTQDAPKFHRSGIYEYDLTTRQSTMLVEENVYRIKYCGYSDGVPIFAGTDEHRYGYTENPFIYRIRAGRVELIARNERAFKSAVGSDSSYGGGTTEVPLDGKLYFVGTDRGDSNIKYVELAAGNICPCQEGEGCVDMIAVGKRGIFFVGMRGLRLQEVYQLCNDGEVRLTSFNEWVVQERTLSLPKQILYRRENVTMNGYVMKPVNWEPGRNYPAILYIHGGHRIAAGSNFHHERQLLTNRGAYVLYCNPRGSDGEDNDYADIIGQYGFLDGEDIMAFLDHCLQQYPDIDRNRLGVCGGSYGGFMTNWLIGHTDRFCCAVSERCMANFLSIFGTSDTDYRFPMFALQTNIWMDPERYWRHSPLKYADKATTPTLFILSENDCRCPQSEGIQMFYALKYHHVPARLCIFKDEFHGLSSGGKPRNRINRLKEIMSWWDQYLGIE